MQWETNLETNQIKNLYSKKNQCQNAACEQKLLAGKQFFVQTPFSHSILYLEQKISRCKDTPFFSSLPNSV